MVIRIRVWIPDHFLHHCGIGDLWAQSTADLYHGEMTDADKIMHPQHFGTDATDIRIRINPVIRIGIPDDLWLIFWRWRMFALSECSCYYYYYYYYCA